MRVRSHYIPLLVLLLALGRAGASVHPVAARAVTAHTHGHEAARGKDVAAKRESPVPHAAPRSVRSKAVSESKTEVAVGGKRSPSSKAKTAHVRDAKVVTRKKAALVSKTKAAEKPAARREPVAAAEEAPAERAVEPAEDTVHVTHDRKVHHTGEDEPKKATPDDFMPDAAAKIGEPEQNAAAGGIAPARHLKKRQNEGANPAAAGGKALPAKLAEPAPVVMAALYTKRGKLIVPAALKGSHEILLHQNEVADAEGLMRVQDDDDLEDMRAGKMLVAIPQGPGLQTDDRLPDNRRYCRPWTAKFLAVMSKAFYARFHQPLYVTSAVRTVEVQERLLRTNGNAAPAEGQTASPHLTGQAVDLAKKGLSMTEIAWVRGYLLPLVQQGKVDVEEEFQQSCFHISVYKKYVPQQDVPKREIAPRRSPVTAMAAAIR